MTYNDRQAVRMAVIFLYVPFKIYLPRHLRYTYFVNEDILLLLF